MRYDVESYPFAHDYYVVRCDCGHEEAPDAASITGAGVECAACAFPERPADPVGGRK